MLVQLGLIALLGVVSPVQTDQLPVNCVIYEESLSRGASCDLSSVAPADPDVELKLFSHVDLFRIRERELTVQPGQLLDREALIAAGRCQNQDGLTAHEIECVLTVELAVTRSGKVKLPSVRVLVADVNDHVPKFNPSTHSVKLELDEDVDQSMHSAGRRAQAKLVSQLPLATDPDYDLNGTVRYALSGPDSALFELVDGDRVLRNDDATNCQQISSLGLRLTGFLDHESKVDLAFDLVASDCAADPALHGRFSKLPIHVIIKEINEYAPTFNLSCPNIGGQRTPATVSFLDENGRELFYGDFSKTTPSTVKIKVPEDLPINNKIFTVCADDADQLPSQQSTYSKVTYAFSQLSDSIVRSTFRISSQDGSLVLSRPLDYEKGPREYSLVVLAKDAGFPSKTSTLSLQIHVSDVNDQKPQIEVRALEQPQGLSSIGQVNILVPENSKPGTFIAKLTATDRDTGYGGQVNCTLQQYNVQHYLAEENFELRPIEMSGKANYELVTRRELDREKTDRIRLRAVCKDQGHIMPHSATSRSRMQLSSEIAIVVQVQDVNDNGPTFAQPYIKAAVSENSAPGRNIVRLPINDPDEDASANRFKFGDTMNQSYANLFEIDSETGLVVTGSEELDRELQDAYILPVSVYDKENDAWKDTATLEITVTDENDNIPAMTGPVEFVTQEFDYKTGKEVVHIGQLQAKDADIDANGEVWFRLADESMSDRWLVQSNGHVKVLVTAKHQLDREQQDKYLVPIIVADRGKPIGLSATYTLTINLEDINDNKPTFRTPPTPHLPASPSPAVAKVTLELSEVTEPGTAIYHVEAFDPDLGDNGRVTYELKENKLFWQGNLSARQDDRYFDIDPVTGEIRVLRQVTDTDKNVPRTWTVVARDGGQPAKFSQAIIYLKFLSPYDTLDQEKLNSQSFDPNRPFDRNDPLSTNSPSRNNQHTSANGNGWTTELILGLGIGLVLLMVICLVALVVVYVCHGAKKSLSSCCWCCWAPSAPRKGGRATVSTDNYKPGMQPLQPHLHHQHQVNNNNNNNPGLTAYEAESVKVNDYLIAPNGRDWMRTLPGDMRYYATSDAVPALLNASAGAGGDLMQVRDSASAQTIKLRGRRDVVDTGPVYNVYSNGMSDECRAKLDESPRERNGSGSEESREVCIINRQAHTLRPTKTTTGEKMPPSPGRPQKQHAGYVFGSACYSSSFV